MQKHMCEKIYITIMVGKEYGMTRNHNHRIIKVRLISFKKKF